MISSVVAVVLFAGISAGLAAPIAYDLSLLSLTEETLQIRFLRAVLLPDRADVPERPSRPAQSVSTQLIDIRPKVQLLVQLTSTHESTMYRLR